MLQQMCVLCELKQKMCCVAGAFDVHANVHSVSTTRLSCARTAVKCVPRALSCTVIMVTGRINESEELGHTALSVWLRMQSFQVMRGYLGCLAQLCYQGH